MHLSRCWSLLFFHTYSRSSRPVPSRPAPSRPVLFPFRLRKNSKHEHMQWKPKTRIKIQLIFTAHARWTIFTLVCNSVCIIIFFSQIYNKVVINIILYFHKVITLVLKRVEKKNYEVHYSSMIESTVHYFYYHDGRDYSWT